MPNYALLQSKILADHASDTDQQIESALNAKSISAKIPIATKDIKQYLILMDLWLAIKDSTSDASRVAVDALNNFEQFTFTNPIIEAKLTQILSALVAEPQVPDFTETHKTQILALGQTLKSWADINWDGRVTLSDIAKVR